MTKGTRSPGLAALALVAAFAASPAEAGCPPEPQPQGSCSSFARSSVSMDAFGHFEWRASRGDPDAAASFVDPAAHYLFCAWDQDRLVVALDIDPTDDCGAATCWETSDEEVAVWRDDSTIDGGIGLFDLPIDETAGPRLRVRGMMAGGIILPIGGGLIVQVVRTEPASCVESFLPAESFTLDDKAAFSAKFDLDR